MGKQLDHKVKIKFLTKILKTQREEKRFLSLNQREVTSSVI